MMKRTLAVYVEDDGGFSYYGGSAIYAGNNYTLQMGPKLTVNGLVDLKVNANGVFANGGHSDIYFKGGNIEINKDNTKGYALLAECATTTMNMGGTKIRCLSEPVIPKLRSKEM
ncbi:MAG: hypothetical protein ACLUIQ_03305 [Dialister invisus]